MACDLTTVQEALCDSDIGKVTDPLQLLQITAQAAANWVTSQSPGTDVTPEAVLSRACDSGIGALTDQTTLLTVIAQNVCNAN